MSRRGKWIFGLCVLAWLGLVTGLIAFAFRDEPPPDVSDFTQPRVEIAPDDNALPLLSEAAALLVKTEDFKALAELEIGDDLTVARRVLAENAAALAKLDEALQRPALQFEPVTSVAQPIPLAPALQDLARLQILRALVFLQDGDARRAIDSFIESAEFGSRVADADGVLIHWLVGAAIWHSAMRQFRDFLPASDLGSEELRVLAQRLSRATPSQNSIASSLRKEWPAMESIITIVTNDPEAFAGIAGDSASKQGSALAVRVLLRPNQTRRRWSEAIREVISAAEHPASEFSQRTPTYTAIAGQNRMTMLLSPNAVGNILTGIALPVYESIVTRKSRTITEAGMTRTLLALRAWWLDHGALPERLEELVPEYLPSIPHDEFDGQPLRYSREKRVLYSVGEDFIDNGGASDPDDKKQQKLEPTIRLDWAMP